ncbi:MAG: hypothetical protein ACYC5H_09510 [Methylovirgula sp.]
MHARILKAAQIAAGAALVLATAFTLPAAAEVTHHGKAHHHHHWHHHHYRPLTVSGRRHHEFIVAAPDPYHGPAAIVTGPNAVAATIVSLPFRAASVVFPPYGNPAVNPLVLIGAPIHFAGEVAEFPFYVVGSAFGAPPHIMY